MSLTESGKNIVQESQKLFYSWDTQVLSDIDENSIQELMNLMKKIIFKGCGTAIITPFTNEGINFQEFEKLINDQIEGGVDSIIVCGTTGESSTMSLDERKAAIKFAIQVANHRVPIVAGTGAEAPEGAVGP